MTYSDSGRRDTLHYRLISQSTEDPGLWGNEYVRHLAAELGEEYLASSAGDETIAPESTSSADDSSASAFTSKAPAWPKVGGKTLLALAMELVPFFLAHNAEADAVDLLLELEAIDKIIDLVGKDNYGRVCLYMVS